MKGKKSKSFDCKDFNRLAPLFLNDTLEYGEVEEFLKHMEHCDECMEELMIQFLVSKGVASLEEGNNFNLNQEFRIKVNDYKRDLKYRKQAMKVLYILEAVAVVLLLALFAMLVFMR